MSVGESRPALGTVNGVAVNEEELFLTLGRLQATTRIIVRINMVVVDADASAVSDTAGSFGGLEQMLPFRGGLEHAMPWKARTRRKLERPCALVRSCSVFESERADL